MTLFQDNTRLFATTRQQRDAETANEIDNAFTSACKRAVELFRQGRPGQAEYVIARAWDRCVRIHNERCPR